MKPVIALVVLLLALVASQASCIDQAEDPMTCVPNQIVDCQCALGAAGYKVCNSQGSDFTVCQCQGGADAGMGDSSFPDAMVDATTDARD